VVIPSIAVITLEEQIAEKLARYRRASLARDLYDLGWCAAQPFDKALVRRLWVLKCYSDIVEDGLGTKPIEAADILGVREESSFASEQIGYLTKPVDVASWVQAVRSRFSFLADLDADEMKWASASPGDRWEVHQVVKALL